MCKDIDERCLPLAAVTGYIIKNLDVSLNPRWVRVVHREISSVESPPEGMMRTDFFSSTDAAEKFLKLRSRCLVSLLMEWAAGSSKITAKDYGALLSVANCDNMIDELAAIDVLPYAEPRQVRVGFWTSVLDALDPEVSQSVSQSMSQSVSQSVSQ